VQILLSDNKCQELWVLLQQTRKVDGLSNQDMIRYRREAERHVGADEHLYRFDWVCEILNFGIICAPDMK
jgi:paired amphipathic helix protein Sin3a